MSSELHYRSYVIYTDGREFVAEPRNADDDVVFEIGCKKVDCLVMAIDELWDSLGNVKSVKTPAPTPYWFQEWLDGGCSGRINIIPTPELIEFRTERSMSWLDKLMRIGVTASLSVAVCFGCVRIGAKLDTDGDTIISMEEVSDFLSGRPWDPNAVPVLLRRHVEYNGNRYKVSWGVSPTEPNVLLATSILPVSDLSGAAMVE